MIRPILSGEPIAPLGAERSSASKTPETTAAAKPAPSAGAYLLPPTGAATNPYVAPTLPPGVSVIEEPSGVKIYVLLEQARPTEPVKH
jgi:hypothetical protein